MVLPANMGPMMTWTEPTQSLAGVAEGLKEEEAMGGLFFYVRGSDKLRRDRKLEREREKGWWWWGKRGR